jgi:hypothetical protein
LLLRAYARLSNSPPVSADVRHRMQNATANSAGGDLAPDVSIAVFDDLHLFSGSRN